VLGLPKVLPKFLSGQCHSVHAERTQRGQRIEEPRQDVDVGHVVCGIERLREMPPFFGAVKRYALRKENLTYRALNAGVYEIRR
jgi:hypothetical protein